MSAPLDRTNGRSNEPLLPISGRDDSIQSKGNPNLSRFTPLSLPRLNKGLGNVVKFGSRKDQEEAVGNFELHGVTGEDEVNPSRSPASLLVQFGILSCVLGAKSFLKEDL